MKILYVNDTAGEYVSAFDIQPDGTLKNRRNFARLQGVQKTDTGVNSGADGLAIDSKTESTSARSPAFKSSAQKVSRSVRFHFHGRRRTWHSAAQTRKPSTSSAVVPLIRSRCLPKASRGA